MPDISKFNTSKVENFSAIFSKCTSLISIPDISNWKTQSLKETYFLFSDCYLLLYLPDISKWYNYNKDQLSSILDYKKLNDIFNFSPDIIIGYNLDDEEIEKKFDDKFNKFFN